MGSSSVTLRVSLSALVLLTTMPRAGHALQFGRRPPVFFLAAAGANHDKGGYLGIMFHDVAEADVTSLRLKDAHGAEIVMVDHDGPAGKAGLRLHDVVLSVNSVVVEGEDQLRRILRDLQPGRSVSMIVYRDGSERTVNATLGNREELEKQAWEKHWTVPQPLTPQPANAPNDEAATVAPAEPQKPGFARNFMPKGLLPLSPPYTGAMVDAVGGQLAEYFGVHEGSGLLVHAVESNSPAAAAGLHAGDVITRINGVHVASEKDWNRSLHEGKGHAVSITVIRERGEQILTMLPDAKKRSEMERTPIVGVPLIMLAR